MLRLSFCAIIAMLCARPAGCEIPEPRGIRDGLCLWLASDQGIDAEDGKVSGWRDQSASGHVARPPADALAPGMNSKHRGLDFGDERLLQIHGEVLPPDCRAVTIVAVACVASPNSVVIFGNREGSTPLIQLDINDDGLARFIVRDKQSTTLQSLVRAPLGQAAIYAGTLACGDNGEYTATVSVGSESGARAAGPLTVPLSSLTSWIGGLRIGRQRYSFDGVISEVLVYNRVLTEVEQAAIRDWLTAKYQVRPPAPPVPAEPDSFAVLSSDRTWPEPTSELETEVCVIGAGSGGTGAALAASRHGARVVVVERQKRLGGTGTNAFVASWEPGPGCSLAEEIFDRMHRIPGGAGVAVGQHKVSDIPMGFYLVTDNVPYSATLRRLGVKRKANVSYRPEVFDRVVREMLAETGKATVLDQTTFFRAEVEGRHVVAVRVSGPDGTVTRIRAGVFIDCTGDGYVCRSAGCETVLGADPRSRFGESLAPEGEGILQLNAISRCYSIRPSPNPAQEPPPSPPVRRFPRCAWITGWKDGARVINPMPMLPGRTLVDCGYDECLRRTEAMARAHWNWLQQFPEVAGYELDEIAPMLGIREGYRVVTEYVLCQADLEAGLPSQTHPDIIAVADHSCDIHGAGRVSLKLKTGYGIPYRCLIPKGGWSNLLVACRGGGFSHIAASSCRLQRTIIQLGHAAGAAAAMAVRDGCSVADIDVGALVAELDARSRYPMP